MIQVQSFTDRKGNKVNIGDKVGYFNQKGELLVHADVARIEKSGYFIEIFTFGNKHPWYRSNIEKINLQEESA